MAGGNITRIVGGKNSIETEEWIVYTEKFTAYAGKGSHFTADGGTNFGNPKKVPSVGNYFKKAWWSSDYEGTKKITKAKVGDKVYFQVEMTDKFPQISLPKEKQQKITFALYEFTGNKYSIGYMYVYGPRIYLDKEPQKDKEIKYVTWEDKNKNDKIDPEEEYSKKPYNEEKVNGNKAVISFQLSDALASYFNEFAELKLFMSLSYDWETIDLPETENLYLDIEPKPPVIKEIYVRLLNYQVSQLAINRLKEVGGSIQYIEGNDDIMSEKVNMDYFSVRIDELPTFANGNIILLYKKIRENFLTLSKGNVTFESHSEPFHNNIDGSWEFKPYPKKGDPEYEKEQLRRWKNELGNTVIFIDAGGGLIEEIIGDSGAVLESETNPYDMCWIFTTIVTEESKTQPFSGHRQFGIHKDEEGNYRFFARAIDRIWPTPTIVDLSMGRKDYAVKDYLKIADSTWNNLINKVSQFIIKYGGKTTIMQPEFVRTDFNKFRDKYKKTPVTSIGNIPQYKEIQENEI
ncbi:hypothetical protein HZQ57_14785 [Elizabethkingia anophelis]|nr:hypothetical protein [Elizabethkingia anophelis]MCT3813665.1 hypothetical protein [Elizabethkingia anophelis]MCT3820759.1 hypothetical protein [Elizabethkingia anophelis]